MPEAIAFWILSVIAVVAGIAVFRVDSMARATYALAISFVAVGGAVLLLRLDYIGLITVLMMVMEMAIMAIFMIMLMGMNPALMPMSMVHNNKGAVGISVAVFLALAAGAVLVPWPAESRELPGPRADRTAALGEAIMGPHMLVMMTVGAVLFATIVAGLVLTLPSGRYQRFGDDLRRRPAQDSRRGGLGR
nr:NADH-quinone oxidoreductase subunit J [Dietzia alimentaria]